MSYLFCNLVRVCSMGVDNVIVLLFFCVVRVFEKSYIVMKRRVFVWSDSEVLFFFFDIVEM